MSEPTWFDFVSTGNLLDGAILVSLSTLCTMDALLGEIDR